MASDNNVLSIEKLSVRFPGAAQDNFAVRDLSFSLRAGGSMGIVGESGSGKSTVCLAVMGLEPPGTLVTGSINFDGVELVGADEKKKRAIRGRDIGLIYQDPMAALNPLRTIGFQVREPMRVHLGVSKAEANARAIELLSRVGIFEPEKKLSAYPHEFSGGMRQRVVIAMAIACNPKLIIADEPTTALDVLVQQQVLDLLRSLTDEFGISLLLVSHDLAVVASQTDEVCVMRHGAVTEHGEVEQVFREPRHPYTQQLVHNIRRLEDGPAHTKVESK